MTARLLVPTVLREAAGGAAQLTVQGGTVRALLDGLAEQQPLLERRLRDERGALRRHVLVFVNGVQVDPAAGLEDPVPEGAEVFLAPAVSGG